MKKVDCPDCGPTPVDHYVERTGVLLDWFFTPLHRTIAWFQRHLGYIVSKLGFEYLLLGFLYLLTFIRVGKLISELDERYSYRTKVVWKEALRRGIKMRGFLFLGHPTDLLIANYKKQLLIFDALPRPRGKQSRSLLWMDNKGEMRKYFSKAGLPVANGGMFFSERDARRNFEKLSHPVIVKPSEGSRSRHTTINITDEETLLKAVRVAKQLSPWFILEEQLNGFVHRATVIGGKVIGVMRREPPHVLGDGSKTVRELVLVENKNPKRSGPIFHVLEMGEDAEKELARQGLNFESVPEVGRMITLHPKVGRSQGAVNRDVTSVTHIENIILFERVASVLGDDLVGIDFIIADISKSWAEQKKTGVIECNSLPFIDLHHYPYEGEIRDTASALWNVVLPDSKIGANQAESSVDGLVKPIS